MTPTPPRMVEKLLENELVQKYFGCNPVQDGVDWCMAYRILSAMCEPIKKGEKVLRNNIAGKFWEDTFDTPEMLADFHPGALRLPDQFQPKREHCECGPHHGCVRTCSKCTYCPCDCHERCVMGCKKTDPVEGRVRLIAENVWQNRYTGPQALFSEIQNELKALVDLVRKQTQ